MGFSSRMSWSYFHDSAWNIYACLPMRKGFHPKSASHDDPRVDARLWSNLVVKWHCLGAAILGASVVLVWVAHRRAIKRVG